MNKLLERKRKDLLDVLKYKDGDFYVGSLAMVRICHIFNVEYPGNLTDAIKNGCRSKVNEAWELLETYILHMHKYPVEKCPCCGQLRRVQGEKL